MKLIFNCKAIFALCVFLSVGATAQNYELEFQRRATTITNRLADVYAARATGYKNDLNTVPDPEKYNWPAVIGRIKKYGINDDTANARILRFANNPPFHFTMVGMARIMNLYPNAPQMVANKATYLANFWARTDSYNGFTDEGTENHLNMTRTSAYLICQNSLGNPLYPQAAQKMAEIKKWLQWYSKTLYTMGAAEWNSTTYTAYSVIGWLNLYDFAQDPEVKKMARAVLDYFSTEMALHYTEGLSGGADMRGSPNPSISNSATDYMAWLWFGTVANDVDSTKFFKSGEFIQSIHAVTSTYRPNPFVVKLAEKKNRQPLYFTLTRPSYSFDRPKFIPQHFYADRNFSLGAAYIPYGGWTGGSTQIFAWKLVSKIKRNDPKFSGPVALLGNGRYFSGDAGRGLNPFDQLVQHNNTLIQLTCVPANVASLATQVKDSIVNDTLNRFAWRAKWARDFTRRFPSDPKINQNPVNVVAHGIGTYDNANYVSWDSTQSITTDTTLNNAILVNLGRTYVAIHSVSRKKPTLPLRRTSRRFVEDRSTLGNVAGLIVEAVNADNYTSFADFKDSVSAKTTVDTTGLSTSKTVVYTNLKGERISATFTTRGTIYEPLYDWGFGPTTPQSIQTSPPYLQPNWQAAEGFGRIAARSVNGQVQNLDTISYVTVGPGLSHRNLILKFTDSTTNYYAVDYTDSIPRFLPDSVSGTQNKIEILGCNYPNPFSVTTNIGYQLTEPSAVTIKVLNALGQEVAQIENGTYKTAGRHSVIFERKNLKSGLYYCQIQTSGHSEFRAMLITDSE